MSSQTRLLTSSLAVTLAFGSVASASLYRSQLNSGSGWVVNANNADYAATFGYDYSAVGIPEAPNSLGTDTPTSGLKAEANLNSGSLSVFTAYPTGQNFTGNYILRFDAWANYDANERVNGGSAGTTEFLGGGIGYNGTAADVGSGSQLLFTNEGGSGSDWRTFDAGTFQAAADMPANSRDNGNAYYSDFLPGVAPPAAQPQVAYPPGVAGSPGFQWITVEFATVDGLVSMTIEKPDGSRLLIDSFTATGGSDGNVSLTYADYFSSVTGRPDLTFGVFDNIVVSEVPEPTAIAVAALGGTLLLRRRRSEA